jgi:heme O synthase-like polyprenyltransferase
VEIFITIVKFVAILAAAATIGNWYQSNIKKTRAQGRPWYTPYLSLPGILILAIVIGLPTLLFLME